MLWFFGAYVLGSAFGNTKATTVLVWLFIAALWVYTIQVIVIILVLIALFVLLAELEKRYAPWC